MDHPVGCVGSCAKKGLRSRIMTLTRGSVRLDASISAPLADQVLPQRLSLVQANGRSYGHMVKNIRALRRAFLFLDAMRVHRGQNDRKRTMEDSLN